MKWLHANCTNGQWRSQQKFKGGWIPLVGREGKLIAMPRRWWHGIGGVPASTRGTPRIALWDPPTPHSRGLLQSVMDSLCSQQLSFRLEWRIHCLFGMLSCLTVDQWRGLRIFLRCWGREGRGPASPPGYAVADRASLSKIRIIFYFMHIK